MLSFVLEGRGKTSTFITISIFDREISSRGPALGFVGKKKMMMMMMYDFLKFMQ